MRVLLDDKYERSDLHKVTENQCQYLTMMQHNYLLQLLKKLEELLDGTLGTRKTDYVDFK